MFFNLHPAAKYFKNVEKADEFNYSRGKTCSRIKVIIFQIPYSESSHFERKNPSHTYLANCLFKRPSKERKKEFTKDIMMFRYSSSPSSFPFYAAAAASSPILLDESNPNRGK